MKLRTLLLSASLFTVFLLTKSVNTQEFSLPENINKYSEKTANFYLNTDMLSNYKSAEFDKSLNFALNSSVSSVRLKIHLDSWNINESSKYLNNLLNYINDLRKKSLKFEITVFSDNLECTLEESQKLSAFLKFLEKNSVLPYLINLSEYSNWEKTECQPWLKENFQLLKNSRLTKFNALSFSGKNDYQRIKAITGDSSDLYLYKLNAGLPEIQSKLSELSLIGAKDNLQVGEISSPEKLSEYDNAWFYRFYFYFSGRYSLEPLINLYPEPLSTSDNLSVLRDDFTPKPSYLIYQIYSQSGNSDIDKIRLESFLKKRFSDSEESDQEDFVRKMFNAFYTGKTSQLYSYISSSSDIFYDYLKYQLEDNLLKTYSILEELKLENISDNGDKIEISVIMKFLSSYGNHYIRQIVSLENNGNNLKAIKLSDPEPVFSPLVINPKKDNMFSVNFHSQNTSLEASGFEISKKNQSENTEDEYNNLFWFRLKNISDNSIDISSLQLIDSQGRVFIPSMIYLDFYKSLAPGELAEGIIEFPDTDNELSFEVKSINTSSHAKNLKKNFSVKYNMKKEFASLIIINDNLEKADLPKIMYLNSSENQSSAFAEILPKPLLALEKRSVSVPAAFSENIWKGIFYPVSTFNNLMDIAYRYRLLGRLGDSLDIYNYILKRYPKNDSIRVRQEIVNLYVQQKDYKKAEEILNEILKSGASSLAVLKARLYISNENNNTQDIIRFSKEIIEKFPQDKDAYYTLYSTYIKNGNKAEALEIVKKALERFPDDLYLLRVLAYLQKENGNINQAIKTYRQIYQDSAKTDISSLKMLYYLSYEQKNYKDAALYLGDLLRSEPDNPQYLKDLAFIYKEQKNFQAAISYYQKYLNQKNDPQVYKTLLSLFINQKKYQEAISFLSAYRKKYNDYNVYKDLGFIYKEMKNNTLAIENFEKYLSYKKDYTLIMDIAYLYQNMGQLQKAINYFKMPDTFKNDESLVKKISRYKVLAYLLQKSQKYQEAELYYQKLISMGVQDKSEISKNLLVLYLQTNQLNKAMNFVTKFEYQKINNPELLYNIAEVYKRNHDYYKAQDILLRAIEIKKSAPFTYYKSLAESYEKTGNTELAIKYLKIAEELISPKKN